MSTEPSSAERCPRGFIAFLSCVSHSVCVCVCARALVCVSLSAVRCPRAFMTYLYCVCVCACMLVCLCVRERVCDSVSAPASF